MENETTTSNKLVQFLTACGCNEIAPLTLNLSGVEYIAAKYSQTLTAPEGSRNPGEYTRVMIYVLGPLPKRYIRDSKLAFRFDGDSRDWYIAGYFPEVKRGKQITLDAVESRFREVNPLGPFFQLAPWDVPGGETIDKYETRPYTRVPVDIVGPCVKRSSFFSGLLAIPSDPLTVKFA